MGRPAELQRIDPGERAIQFFSRLSHTGDYSGEPFNLRPWQEAPIRKLFGTLRPDGTRQYRKTFWALPRKSGKTEIVAAAGLYLMMGCGRTHQNIYTASGDFKQASLIFAAMAEMIRNDPRLESLCQIYDGAKKIIYPRGDSKLEVLSSVPKSKHGLSPTAVLIDEFHVVEEQLVNVLTTGFGARRDPLTWMITTAGDDTSSLCYDEWQYACQVRDGEVEDPTYLPVIYAADPEQDDWHDEKVWHRVMPALGDFCSLEYIREEYVKATTRPRFESTFKQVFLNLWVNPSTRWLVADRWLTAGRVTAEELRGRSCYAGLDLGIVGDMAAWAGVFPNDDGGVDILVRFWCPENGQWRDEARPRIDYPIWERAGFLSFTKGEATDFNRIEADLVKLNDEYPFLGLLADRAYGTQILSSLHEEHDIPVRGIPQGPVTMNEPMVRFENMLLEGTIRHEHSAVLGWNVANANVRRSSTGLMYLDKASTVKRIDGLAAVLDGLAGMIAEPAKGESVYNRRGLLFL